MKDVTFMIPVMLDSEQRLRNIRRQIWHLTEMYSDCVIKVIECDTKPKLPKHNFMKHAEHSFVPIVDRVFHRTKLLNQLTKDSDTDIVVIHDADVFIHPDTLRLAAAIIRAGVDFCYPYARYRHVGGFNKIYNTDAGLVTKNALGGSIFCNRASYIASGMENEHFISWGCEDVERYHRWRILEYAIARLDADLYHIEHPRPRNSSTNHPHYKANKKECEKVLQMHKKRLQAYIKTWKWLNV